jgi:hypothetical protein
MAQLLSCFFPHKLSREAECLNLRHELSATLGRSRSFRYDLRGSRTLAISHSIAIVLASALMGHVLRARALKLASLALDTLSGATC